MRHFGIAVALLTCVLAACGKVEVACSEIFAYGLNVTVKDATSGARICTASVTAVEDGTSERLTPIGPSGECVYVGAGENPGTFTVTATKTGYASKSVENLVVSADECHVQGVQATIELVPSS